MINICYFLGTLNVGGAENLVLQIIRNLDKSKYKVYIAVFSKKGALLSEYEKLGVEIVEFPQKKKVLSSAFRFARFLKQKRIDCIHINLTGTFLFSVTMSWLMRVKNIIIHWHSVYSYISGKSRYSYENLIISIVVKYLSSFAHSIIAISKAVKDNNCEVFKVDRSKVHVVYNGLDFSHISALVRHSEDAGTPFKIGSVGKVFKKKGFKTLIEAVEIVTQTHSNCSLEIIGATDESSTSLELLALPEKLGIADRVKFSGVLPNHEVYQRLFSWNLFVLASEYEGFGLVIVEAMAAGTPVIASNVDAFPEIIEDGKTGLLFPVNNAPALADQIRRLIDDQSLADSLAANAKADIDRFSIGRLVNELDSHYSKAT